MKITEARLTLKNLTKVEKAKYDAFLARLAELESKDPNGQLGLEDRMTLFCLEISAQTGSKADFVRLALPGIRSDYPDDEKTETFNSTIFLKFMEHGLDAEYIPNAIRKPPVDLLLTDIRFLQSDKVKRWVESFLKQPKPQEGKSLRNLQGQYIASQFQGKGLLFELAKTMEKKEDQPFAEPETEAAVSILNTLCDVCPQLLEETQEYEGVSRTPFLWFLSRGLVDGQAINLTFLKALVFRGSAFYPRKPEKVAVHGSSTMAVTKTMEKKEELEDILNQCTGINQKITSNKIVIVNLLLLLSDEGITKAKFTESHAKVIKEMLSLVLEMEIYQWGNNETGLLPRSSFRMCHLMQKLAEDNSSLQEGIREQQFSFYNKEKDDFAKILRAYVDVSPEREQEKFRYLDVVALASKESFSSALVSIIDKSLEAKELSDTTRQRLHTLIQKFMGLVSADYLFNYLPRSSCEKFFKNVLNNILKVHAIQFDARNEALLNGVLQLFQSVRAKIHFRKSDFELITPNEFDAFIVKHANESKDESMRNTMLSFVNLSTPGLDAKLVQEERERRAFQLSGWVKKEKEDKTTVEGAVDFLTEKLCGGIASQLSQAMQSHTGCCGLFDIFTICHLESPNSPKLVARVMIILSKMMSLATRPNEAIRYALLGCIVTWRDKKEASQTMFRFFCSFLGIPSDRKEVGKRGTPGYEDANIEAITNAFLDVQPHSLHRFQSDIKGFKKAVEEGWHISAAALRIWKSIEEMVNPHTIVFPTRGGLWSSKRDPAIALSAAPLKPLGRVVA